eukprot:TRINITY_DN10631_c0_g1_i1.p1 TRINITY_DN10631_c0_g1~~TRINITY_DN10631_c0_g1_i1.p1  ORF type:complete len:163 (-),score=40.86 TRINITY_DN10631_c0_g1_i1:21-509(-)
MKSAMQGDHVSRIKERLMLMELLLHHGTAESSSELKVFKIVKYFGKEALEGEQLRLYEDMFKRAKGKLTPDQLEAGRQMGIYVKPEEEHIFGPNMVYVAQNQKLPDSVGTCRDPGCNGKCGECREVMGMVQTIVDRGGPVSYTHRTLPTLYSGYIAEGAVVL